MAERDDEAAVEEGVNVNVEVPDSAPDWVRRSIARANRQAGAYRLKAHAAESETAEERKRREAAEKKLAELEAGGPTEAVRLDKEFSLTIAELGVPNPREFYELFRPHAKFDERGRIVVETEDRGTVSLIAAIPRKAWDSMGSPGSGSKRTNPAPEVPTTPRRAAEPDALGSQAAWRSMTPAQQRAYSERVINEAKQREGAE